MKLAVYIFAILAIGLQACSTRNLQKEMDCAEQLLDTHPDSALAILNNIAPHNFLLHRNRARYALLQSMALDKNSINTTTFDILQPALDYYLTKGTPGEKLRTYYCQARIYQRQSRSDRVLSVVEMGIVAGTNCTAADSIYLAHSYKEQASAYYDLYDMADYVRSSLKAAAIYHQLDHKNDEADMLLNGLNGAVMLRNKHLADSIMAQCLNIDSMCIDDQSILHQCKITYMLQFGSRDEIRRVVNQHQITSHSHIGKNIKLALAYSRLGENDKALHLLNSVKESKCKFDTLKYLTIAIEIMESMGNEQELAPLYKQYITQVDKQHQRQCLQERQAIAESLQMDLTLHEQQRTESLRIWSGISVIIFMILVTATFAVTNRHNRLQKKQHLERANSAEAANEQLSDHNEFLRNEITRMQQQLTDTELSSDATKAIKERIEVFNYLLANEIATNEQFYNAYEEWIKSLTANPDEFMNSLRLTFQASHPKFIKYLQDKELTSNEINYVCLYAIGLRGKEVGNYLKKRGHVNISSAIRKKLGIDRHETNLGIYVRKLLKQS